MEGVMCKRIAGVLIGSFLVALILTPTISSARIYLFDQKLEINGSIEQKANWKYTLKDWERGRGDNRPAMEQFKRWKISLTGNPYTVQDPLTP